MSRIEDGGRDKEGGGKEEGEEEGGGRLAELPTYCRSRPSKESSTLYATNGAAAALAGSEWIRLAWLG